MHRVMFLYLMGHDVSTLHIHAVKLAQENKSLFLYTRVTTSKIQSFGSGAIPGNVSSKYF